MAQWVKVGNIRGPAGEIPDVSEFIELRNQNGDVYKNNRPVSKISVLSSGTNDCMIRAALSKDSVYQSSELANDTDAGVSSFSTATLVGEKTARVNAFTNTSLISGFDFLINQNEPAALLNKLTIRCTEDTSYIGNVTNPVGAIYVDPVSDPVSAEGTRVPNLNTVKSMISGLVKATTDEEHGTGASLLTSDGKAVDSVVFPGTDESIASIGSDYFFINKDTNTVEFNVTDYEGLKRATAAFYVKNAEDVVTSYLELGCSNANQTNVGTEGNPVDLLYAADLDDAATDKRVPNKKYVDDAIEGMLTGGSVEKLFEGTAMTKSVSDDYTIFVLQLFNNNYTTIQVFPRHTARYTIPNPTYNGTYVKLDMDVTWSISAQTVTFESTSNSIELIYGIK